jgi:hypothetical protein
VKKNKHKKFVLFFIATLLFSAGFFGFVKCWADDPDIKPGNIIINEMMWMGMNSVSSDEWIELKNNTSNELPLFDCHIVKKDNKDIVKSTDLENKAIPAGDFFVISYKSKDDSKINVTTNKILSYLDLSNTEILIKLECSGDIIDEAGDGGIPLAGENESIKKSMERNDKIEDGTKKSSWHTCYKAANLDDDSIDCGTPGKENSTKSSDDTNSNDKDKPDYSGKVKINEIVPSPATGEKEMIEIINLSDKAIDFSQWYVKDEKNNKKILSAGTARNNFYYKQDSFSLNSDGDSVYLYDENNNLIDTLKYAPSQTNKAYAYDSESSAWRWTSKKTPGEKNLFDKKLLGKIKKDDPAYIGMYANFSVDADSDAQKFTWDFGDGHKSYLKDAKHKYEKTGDYSASLKISGNGETSEYFFTVKVEKYKAPKIRISSVSPNPKGVDTKKEYITLQNKSKKKINLKDWSVAMGWDSLVNHPIREDFIVKAGKSKKLTQKICAFTLNNTKTKIELRDPSGKVAQKIEYDRTTNKIEEDEIYQKGGAGWDWLKAQTDADTTRTNADNIKNDTEINTPPEEIKNPEENIITLSDTEIREGLGKFSEDPNWTAKKETRIILLGYNTGIKTPPYILEPFGRVAGASTKKNVPPPQKHWTVKLLYFSWIKINSGMNWILNRIL